MGRLSLCQGGSPIWPLVQPTDFLAASCSLSRMGTGRDRQDKSWDIVCSPTAGVEVVCPALEGVDPEEGR